MFFLFLCFSPEFDGRMVAVDDADGSSVLKYRHTRRLNHKLVDAAVGRCGDQAPGVHLPDDLPAAPQCRVRAEACRLAFQAMNRQRDSGNGLVAVADWPVTRPLPVNEPIEIRTDVVVLGAAGADTLEVRICDAAIVVIVE